MRRSTVVLIPEREVGGFPLQVPALLGCFTERETVEECLANARDLIALFIEELTARGEPIHEDNAPLQLATVAV